jgi:hypothetical protein
MIEWTKTQQKKNLAQSPLGKIYTMHNVDTWWWQNNVIQSGIGQFMQHFQMFIRGNLRRIDTKL